MRSYIKFLAFGFIGMLMLQPIACGKKDSAALANEGSKAFQSAEAGLKAAWDTAVAADKTNGYVVAITTLQMLVAQPGLTDKQSEIARNTLTAISDKMYDAANREDPAAKQALDDLRQLRGR